MSGPADETYKRLFKATPGKILVLFQQLDSMEKRLDVMR